MSKQIIRIVLLLLPTITIINIKFCYGKQLNLTESCSDSQSHSCVLSNIQTSFGNPLMLANSTNFELNELIIRNIGLLRLPREIFDLAPNLHTFVMYNCGLNRMSAYDFENASKLRILILQRNRLSEIAEKGFAAVPSLNELRLGENHIHMMHQLAFKGLTELLYLDLQQNALNQLAQSVFLPLLNLEYLDLSGNEISKIDSSTFAANTKLTTLLLNNNKFIVFEPNSLESFSHWHLLDVSNNNLIELNTQSVDALYAQNSSLKRCNIRGGVIKLHAGNNELAELSIKDKATVRELELHGNLFESLDNFTDLVNLQHLDLSKNHVSSLANVRSPLLLSLPNLNYLNLAFNKLKNLSVENFVLLPKLSHLDIAFNHLISLDAGIFEPLRRLEKLFIDGNGLHTFDYRKFLETHPSLREIGLNANTWNPRQMQEIVAYLEHRSVQLAQHYPAFGNDFQLAPGQTPARIQQHCRTSEAISLSHHLDETEPGQCHSSNKNYMGILTLILVIAILILQIIRLSNGKDCFTLFWRRKRSRLGQQWQTEILDESVSEV